MNSGPVAQFKPIENTPRCWRGDVQRLHALAASIVPIGSMVALTINGTSAPAARNAVAHAERRRFR